MTPEPDAPTVIWILLGVVGLGTSLFGWLGNRAVNALDREMAEQRSRCNACQERVTEIRIAGESRVTKGDLDGLRAELRADFLDLRREVKELLGPLLARG